MDILKGLLLINGVDVFVDYGAFLAEEKAGDTKNYSALLKPPSAKPHTAVSFREKDGEKLPDALLPAWVQDCGIAVRLRPPRKGSDE